MVEELDHISGPVSPRPDGPQADLPFALSRESDSTVTEVNGAVRIATIDPRIVIGSCISGLALFLCEAQPVDLLIDSQIIERLRIFWGSMGVNVLPFSCETKVGSLRV
jgi:hypothetical protein